MGLFRPDGSVESASLGTVQTKYHGIYRAQITDIFYSDNPLNTSASSENPEILYNAIIVGGSMGGSRITNIRNVMRIGGGQYNYSETTLQPNIKGKSESVGTASYKPVNQQAGDMIFIAFQDGNPMFPIIIGFGVNGQNDNGITTAEGPRFESQYNGVLNVIDNQGNYLLQEQGGTIVNGQFVPDLDNSDAAFSMVGQTVTISVNNGQTQIIINGPSDEVSLSANGGAQINVKGTKIHIANDSLDLLALNAQLAGIVSTLSGAVADLASQVATIANELVSSGLFSPIQDAVFTAAATAASNDGTIASAQETAATSVQTDINTLKE